MQHGTRLYRTSSQTVLAAPGYLIVVQGPAIDTVNRPGRTYEIGSRCKVGRLPMNDLVLADDTVSREHCLFQVVNGAYHVEDRQSANGTKVDGRPCGDTRLGACHDVRIGDYHFLFWQGTLNDPALQPQLRDRGVRMLSLF